MPHTPAKVQVQMPWPNQIPPYMYNYQSPVQGYPFHGMQPVPPYYPVHMHWTPNMDDSSHGSAREYRHRQKSSSRKKEKSLDVKGSETSEEEEEQIESGDSDSGSDSDAVKKQDGEHSSGEKLITKKHRKRSSKTVVIRNINYITSDKRNGEKGGVSEGDLSDEGEFIDGDYLKQKVYDAVGSLEKHRKSKSHGHKNKGANRGPGYGNGSNGSPDGDLENDQASDGGKRNDWDALQNLLMRDDDSTINGVKEQQTVDVQGENLLIQNSDNGVPFANSNAIDLGNEKGTMRRTRTTTNDSFILTERVGGNEGRGKLEDFADAEVSRPMMNRGDSADSQLLISRSMEESGISGQRTVSDFLPESSTIRKVTGEDWFVVNQSTKSENQDSTLEQTMFSGDYALSSHKEASKNTPTIDDSFMVQTRSSADDHYNSHWRTDISMVEDSSVVSQPEIVTQDVSQAKKSGAYEPDDLCVMLERNSGLSPGASWAPEMDYETEISFTKSDKKSAPVEMNNPTEEKPLANGKSPNSKKAVGPGTNNLGKEARSKVLRGSLATSRSDILSKSKSRPVVHKSKFEKVQMEFSGVGFYCYFIYYSLYLSLINILFILRCPF